MYKTKAYAATGAAACGIGADATEGRIATRSTGKLAPAAAGLGAPAGLPRARAPAAPLGGGSAELERRLARKRGEGAVLAMCPSRMVKKDRAPPPTSARRAGPAATLARCRRARVVRTSGWDRRPVRGDSHAHATASSRARRRLRRRPRRLRRRGTGSDGGEPIGGGTGGLSVSVDRTSLDFYAMSGATPSSQAVRFTLQNGSGTYYGAVVPDRASFFDASVSITGPTTATATLTPRSPPLGTTTGAVTFKLCRDAACGTVEWSRTLPYTVTTFEVTATSPLAFSAVESTAAPAQTLAVNPPDTRHLLRAYVADAQSSSWLSAARGSDQTFDVTASAQALLAGKYYGSIAVAPPSGGAKLVSVTFTVGKGFVAPADGSATLDLSAAPSGSVPVAFPGGIAPSWSATSDRPWLVLSQAGGTGPGAATWDVDPSKLDAVANWSSDVATVTLTAPGLTAASAHVTLEKKLPEVYRVSPPAVPEGQAATVTVFGRGLSQLTGTAGVAVGSATGVSSAADSDTKATVSLPALAAGRYDVSVPNPHSIATPTAQVAAIAPAAFAYAAVPTTGEKGSAVFDPTRNALYAVGSANDEVLRYRLGQDGAWHVDTLAVPGLTNLALSADGRRLWVTTDDWRDPNAPSVLHAVDPDTLAMGATTWTAPGHLSDGNRAGLQVTSDGRLWLGGGQWSYATYFDPAHNAFAKWSPPGTSYPPTYWSPSYSTSGDGTRMAFGQMNGSSVAFWSAADDRMVSATGVTAYVNYGVALNRDGSRFVVNYDHSVYATDAWTSLGVASTSNYGSSQLSPDGTRLYVPVISSYAIVRVDVFDTTAVTQGTTSLVKLGEIVLADQAESCGANTTGCSVWPVFRLSPLGDVLFLLGNQNLLVVPVAAALR